MFTQTNCQKQSSQAGLGLNDADHYQLDQLRQILGYGYWYGADPYALSKNDLFEEIANAVSRHQLIIAADPSKGS